MIAESAYQWANSITVSAAKVCGFGQSVVLLGWTLLVGLLTLKLSLQDSGHGLTSLVHLRNMAAAQLLNPEISRYSHTLNAL